MTGSKDLPVVLSEESLASQDAREAIQSNIDFVNALFAELLRSAEISHDALVSYYLDYYLAQVNNGGFAQFVYNSGWKAAVVSLVMEGLHGMGAVEHAALFVRGKGLVEAPKNRVGTFLRSAFFGKNAERDRLNVITDEFYSIEKRESLEALNNLWLRSRPSLVVVPRDQLKALIKDRAAAVPDRPVRVAAARAAEPHYMKLIRKLCDAGGHTLDQVTAGDPTNEYNGRRILAWHFITDRGHHFMVEADGKAMMFSGKSKEKLLELSV